MFSLWFVVIFQVERGEKGKEGVIGLQYGGIGSS